MAFPYKHVLLIGATAGIGQAMADRLVLGGAKVTVVGRRKERLDELVEKHGTSKVHAIVFDISERDKIPQFVSQVTAECPDVDSIFLNAGVQVRHDFSHPEQFTLEKFNEEINVNFLSFVALSHAFLPHLLKNTPTSIIYTTSNLSLVPLFGVPGYSASKAALQAFILCLREQLKSTNVKIVELSPPAVQTELHDYMGEEVGRSFGMPIGPFTEEAYQGLAAGKDEVVVGQVGKMPKEALEELLNTRRKAFDDLSALMRGH